MGPKLNNNLDTLDSLLSGGSQLVSLDISGAVTIGGNLTVNGTTTTLNSTTLTIDDKLITVASGAADAAAADGGGLEVDGASATITYASSGDKWVFNKPVDVTGNIIVSGTVDGRDLATDGGKLDGIEAGATADQTAAEIKTAYESNSNTNAFTDALQTKLSGIETGATGDQTATEILTAIKTVDGASGGQRLAGRSGRHLLPGLWQPDRHADNTVRPDRPWHLRRHKRPVCKPMAPGTSALQRCLCQTPQRSTGWTAHSFCGASR